MISNLLHLPLKKQQGRYFLLIVALLLVWLSQAQAQQLHFIKTKVAQGYHFKYQWLDQGHSKQALNFTLSEEGLFNRFRQFKAYQSS